MRRMEFWCAECRAQVFHANLITWPPCQANGYRLLDFCGYPCAEKFRARMMADVRSLSAECEATEST